MLLNRDKLKLHRAWIILFTGGLILSIVALYDFDTGRLNFPGGSSTTGYLLGVLAGLIIVFEILLWPRKKLLRRWRFGRVRTWMSAHIWLGLLTVPIAIVHAGFPWGGSLALVAIILLLVVVASGVFGLVLQQYIPRQMTNASPGESVYSQIDVVARQIVLEADALVSATTGSIRGKTNWSELYPKDKGGTAGVVDYIGASRSVAGIYGKAVVVELPRNPIPDTQILGAAYEAQIRDYLEFGKKGRSPLIQQARQNQFFTDLADKVDPDAHFAINELKQWCDERRQLDHQKMLHHWLHLWLAVHLPLSLALLVIVVWHAIVATKYSGIFSLFKLSGI